MSGFKTLVLSILPSFSLSFATILFLFPLTFLAQLHNHILMMTILPTSQGRQMQAGVPHVLCQSVYLCKYLCSGFHWWSDSKFYQLYDQALYSSVNCLRNCVLPRTFLTNSLETILCWSFPSNQMLLELDLGLECKMKNDIFKIN